MKTGVTSRFLSAQWKDSCSWGMIVTEDMPEWHRRQHNGKSNETIT